jgi:hypothetical protein
MDRGQSTALRVSEAGNTVWCWCVPTRLAVDDFQPWVAEFEIAHRRLVGTNEARAHVCDPDEVATRISHRALEEAGIG